MTKIKSITLKNFLSVGNVTQAINLDEHGLTLILGENVDLGGGGSRNGVGKTTIIQAISFALYGQPLTKIKKDNLINKTNSKTMVVTMDFQVENNTYRIERGRKPTFLRFYVNDGLVNDENTDEAHGESKITQEEIERVIGCSHKLFKHIIALHSKTTPFLDMSDKDQREIIEELLGISQLSKKADKLKELTKQVKDEIKSEEIRIKMVQSGNEKFQQSINELKFKDKLWEKENVKNIEKLEKAIDQLKEIDIEVEINNQKRLVEWKNLSQEVTRFNRDTQRLERDYNSLNNQVSRIGDQLKTTEENKCHTCGQDVHDEKHEQILKSLQEQHETLIGDRQTAQEELFEIIKDLETSINNLTALGDEPKVSYDTMEQAINHRHTLDKLEGDLEKTRNAISPFIDQIANISSVGIQDIGFEYLNELIRLKEHQDFLFKLLTDKNSFIRKKIIDQNLSFLNVRLNSYADKIQLTKEVTFQSDLSVEIMERGKEYDFAQLSNGESTRLVLALAWAFRDVWETMNHPMNLLLIDELVDSGMDPVGMDLALEILKKMARDRNKNIFLISHNDGLTSRVPRILLVQKENNFTTFVTDTEENE
jgi:DNA repair exonuclease SbcCD ATPase subunit